MEELEAAVNRANRGKKNADGEPAIVTVAPPTYEDASEESPAS
jgi:hypothetical protein